MNTYDIDPEDEPILTIEAAARILRRHPALVRRWIAAGLIPTVQQTGGHRKHMLGYKALKMIEAMPRARGTKTVRRQTTVTRRSTGDTQTVTYPVEEDPE